MQNVTPPPSESPPIKTPKGKAKAKAKAKAKPPPVIQKVIVEVERPYWCKHLDYRLERPKNLPPRWRRTRNGRLVSSLPSRPNLGGRGDLECFYHVRREPGEVLPPPGALWLQRYGDDQTVWYRPDWNEGAGNLTDVLRRRSMDSEDPRELNGDYGLPYLFVHDEDAEPDEQGERCRRWRPLKVIANGGFGVIILYVDETRGFHPDDEIDDDDKIVAKFNFQTGDLVDILASVIKDIGVSYRLSSESDALQSEDEEGQEPTPESTASPASRAASRAARRAARRAHVAERIERYNREMGLSPLPVARSRPHAARSGRRSDDSRSTTSSTYSHFQKPVSPELSVDAADTFRLETQCLEMLDMTGSPHFPKVWKLAKPPQDGTLCTMDYVPGGRTFNQHLDLESNLEVPIRLMWEAILCLSKALSVMAYGSEDPAPSHRVHGWNQIVNLDWKPVNIFVRLGLPSHTCSHEVCYMAGDFGFALIVPNTPRARAAYRLGHLQLDWHKGVHQRMPEAQIDTKMPLRQRIDDPIIGHFSHKTNVFGVGNIMDQTLGNAGVGKSGHRRYTQDNLTQVERFNLDRDLESYLPKHQRCGEPLTDEDDPRVRGYLDVAESLIKQPVLLDERVSKQRFVELFDRCIARDPNKRPEIEEIMLSAARGMAEAGEYVPCTPSSSSST